MSEKLFLFVEGSLSFSTPQNVAQFYQTSKKPRQLKKALRVRPFLCVCVVERTLRKSMACVQVTFSFQKIERNDQTEEHSHQAWTEAERQNFVRFSYQNSVNMLKRVQQFD